MKKINFKVITLFPDLITAYLKDALLSKALKNDLLSVDVINLRDQAQKKYNSVDDTVFGGGDGMLLQCGPLVETLKLLGIQKKNDPMKKIILLSPQGQKWTHKKAQDWINTEEIILVCGRYAGVDQRFIRTYVDEEISIGDFILSGGELAALAIIESMSRFIPGVLGHAQSATEDSFENGYLEAPQFTKPQDFEGQLVPQILLSGNHQKIAEWRHFVSLLMTFKKRPDLLQGQKMDWQQVKAFYDQMPSADKMTLGISDLTLDFGLEPKL